MLLFMITDTTAVTPINVISMVNFQYFF